MYEPNPSGRYEQMLHDLDQREGRIPPADKHYWDQDKRGWRQGNPMVYATPTLPDHWIAEANDHHLYIFPYFPGGWRDRKPYRGHVEGLHRVAPVTARAVVEAAGAGFDLIEGAKRPWIAED